MTKNTKKTVDIESVLKWNDYSVDLSTLPAGTIFALAQRGFNHILGNEVAAYESGLKAKRDEHGEAAYSATEIAVMVNDRRDEKIAEMVAGTLGYRASGPRLPADERILRDIARENIVARFHQLSRAKDMPKASNGAAWDSLVDQYLANEKTASVAKAELERRKASRATNVPEDELDAMLAGLKAA